MLNSWKFKLEYLGKLKDIDLTVTPFMIFVGENNSGKSYLMEFLWGILSQTHKFLNINKFGENLNKFNPKEYLINVKQKVDKEELKKINNCFNQLLNENKEDLVKEIFNYPLSVGHIDISFNLENEIEIYCTKVNNPVIQPEELFINIYNLQLYYNGNPFFNVTLHSETEYKDQLPQILISLIYSRIALYLLRRDFYEEKTYFSNSELMEPIYFPASRTGFMHTYRAIIGNQRKNKELVQLSLFDIEESIDSKQIAGTSLTLPTVLFLEKLQKMDIEKEFSDESIKTIQFFETNILKGKIQKNQFEQLEFLPANTKLSLPLHVTSSLIAELSPMYLFLKSTNRAKLWIIEEIESHLNPKIQIEVMRLLVRLFNDNQKAIWITTHSDSVVQRMNNLITLSHTKNEEVMKKLNYTESDLFSNLEIIKAYEFQLLENNTCTIKDLEMTEFGFDFTVFNDVISSLIKETYLVQEVSEEDV